MEQIRSKVVKKSASALKLLRRTLGSSAQITVDWLTAVVLKAKKQWKIALRTLVEDIEILLIERRQPRIGLTRFLRNSWSCVP